MIRTSLGLSLSLIQILGERLWAFIIRWSAWLLVAALLSVTCYATYAICETWGTVINGR